VDALDQPVAAGDHQPPQERGADAAVLEPALDRDGELRRPGPPGPEQLELTDAADLAARHIADDETTVPVEPVAIGGDLGDARIAAEAQQAVVALQPQQVIPHLAAL
jgi:hypothetical protein